MTTRIWRLIRSTVWLICLIILLPWWQISDQSSHRTGLLVSAGCKKCKSKPVIAIETKKVIPIPVPYPVYRKKKCKKKPKHKTIVITVPEKKKCGGYGGCGQQYYYDYYAPPIYYDYYEYVDVPGGFAGGGGVGGGVGGVGFGGGVGGVGFGGVGGGIG